MSVTPEQPVKIIEIWPLVDECCVCGVEGTWDYGLPMYEDEILPGNWKGEWGGFTACGSCYRRFRDIKEPLSLSAARKQIKP